MRPLIPDNTAGVYFIFSSQHDVDQILTDKGIPFKPLTGCWEGKQEQSWIASHGNYLAIQETGLLVGEDCYLLLGSKDDHNLRPATLIYLTEGCVNGSIEDVGKFQQCTRARAMVQTGWTYDPTTGHYFTVFPD